jgi:hypothetical protein
VLAETGLPPEFMIKHAENVRDGAPRVISNDPDIKILVLGRRGRRARAPARSSLRWSRTASSGATARCP